MKIKELMERLKAMPEKMMGFSTGGEPVILDTNELAEELNESLRNADVGTEEQQRDRLEAFCAGHFRYNADNPCAKCPNYKDGDTSLPCVYRFLQMPYDGSGESEVGK